MVLASFDSYNDWSFKASGLGRLGNPWVVEEYTVTKWVSI